MSRFNCGGPGSSQKIQHHNKKFASATNKKAAANRTLTWTDPGFTYHIYGTKPGNNQI